MPAAGAPPETPPLVIVAEDDEGSRSALLEVLRDGGFRAVGAADGVELVELAASLRPAAVVLDLAMPRLNGIEAASTLRGDSTLADVPIIAVTASWLGERTELLTAVGFHSALRKPFAGERLLAELRSLLCEPALQQAVEA